MKKEGEHGLCLYRDQKGRKVNVEILRDKKVILARLSNFGWCMYKVNISWTMLVNGKVTTVKDN